MTSALSDLTSKAVAYDMYWNQEFTPVLNRHRIPPLLEGYQLFLKSDDARKRVEEIAQLQLEEEKTDKYDTHPSMKARLEAIAELEETNASVDNTSALSLLDDPEKQERTLLKALIKDSEYSKMSPIAWNAEVNELFIANWEETTVQIGKVLKPMTPPDLPAFVKDPLSFVEDQASVKGMDDQVAPQVINNLIYGVSTGLALLLCRQGFRMEMSVGSEPKMMRDGVELQPLSVIGRLVSKQLSQDEWLEQCRELGIYDQSLFVEAKTAEKQEDLHQSQ